MSQITYEASVYSRKISYKNLKGEVKEVELTFALDPIQLMRLVASVPTPKKSKSNNPALRAKQEEEITEEQQLKFLVDIAAKAAGEISEDGESFDPIPDFQNLLVGKAFITKLASSDGDRKEFAEKVIIDPFKAFVEFAAADEGNTPAEIADFRKMAEQIERVFTVANDKDEDVEARRLRLAAELASLDKPSDEA